MDQCSYLTVLISIILGLVGFICGATFSSVLAFAERRKTLAELSLGRAAMWGLIDPPNV